jgi:hypothetical protein
MTRTRAQVLIYPPFFFFTFQIYASDNLPRCSTSWCLAKEIFRRKVRCHNGVAPNFSVAPTCYGVGVYI